MSFRPRSTAAPECTSSTSAESWPAWSRSACSALARPASQNSSPPAIYRGKRFPPDRHGSALRTMSVGLRMAADVEGVDLLHSHTWYANFGGHLAKLLYDIPHVVTTHSLEPLRPWKAEQLGAGYALSSFCEQTAIAAADAVIAVSESTRRDVAAGLSERRARTGPRHSQRYRPRRVPARPAH